jgi:hypothetical protein
VSEPFAGERRVGASGWTEQVPLPNEPYLRDLALSAAPLTGKRDLPHDLAVRLATEDPDFELVPPPVSLDGRPPSRSDGHQRSTLRNAREVVATPGQQLSCVVTPSDGRRAGPTAGVSAIVG